MTRRLLHLWALWPAIAFIAISGAFGCRPRDDGRGSTAVVAAPSSARVDATPPPQTANEGSTTVSTENDAKKEVIEGHRAMYRAMVARRTDELSPLLADDYSLTHMTGYKQPKREWLAAIDSGQMRYHAADEKSVTVDLTGTHAKLVGKSVVDATIYGSRGTWNLQLTTDYEKRADRWIAMRTVATTF